MKIQLASVEMLNNQLVKSCWASVSLVSIQKTEKKKIDNEMFMVLARWKGVGGGTLPFNKVGSKLWFVMTFPHSTTFQTGPITSQRWLWDKNMFLLTGRSKDLPEAIFCICAQLQIFFFFPLPFSIPVQIRM